MIYHSNFYGKKLVGVLLQPLVNWRLQAESLTEVLLALNAEYVSVNGLIVINFRIVGNPEVSHTSSSRDTPPSLRPERSAYGVAGLRSGRGVAHTTDLTKQVHPNRILPLAKQIPHNYQSPRRCLDKNSRGDLLACSSKARTPGVATMRPGGKSGIVGKDLMIHLHFQSRAARRWSCVLPDPWEFEPR